MRSLFRRPWWTNVGAEFSTTNDGALPPAGSAEDVGHPDVAGAKEVATQHRVQGHSGYIGYKPVTDFDVRPRTGDSYTAISSWCRSSCEDE